MATKTEMKEFCKRASHVYEMAEIIGHLAVHFRGESKSGEKN